LITQTITY